MTNAVCLLLFGFSFSLWFAVIIRILNGTLNSNIAIVKCCIRDITDETNQARVYSIRSIGYALGSVIGPIIGGFFAQPYESPELSLIPVFTSAIFVDFPYFLGCFVGACVNIASFIVTWLFLKETLKKKKTSKFELKSVEMNFELDSFASENLVSVFVEPNASVNQLPNQLLSNTDVENTPDTLEKKETHAIKNYLLDSLPFPLEMFTVGVVSTCALYIFNAFFVTIIAQANPVWLSRDSGYQGLAFNERQIGITNGFAGICSFIFQVALFPNVDKWIGQTNSYRLSVIIFIPAVILLPFISYLDHDSVLMWVALLFCIGIFGVTANWSFASVNLLVCLLFNLFPRIIFLKFLIIYPNRLVMLLLLCILVE